MKIVHILVAGQALCGKPGVPKEWEKDHVWATRQEALNLTDGELEGVELCAACKERLGA